MKSLHIVIDGRFLRRTTGGIGRYTQALIDELAQLDSDYRYTVVISQEDWADWLELADRVKLRPDQWRAIVSASRHYSYQEQIELPRLLASLQPDLVHFTNFNHPILWQRPFVITIHDLTIFRYPVGARQESALAQLAFRTVVRHALSRAKEVITVSETSKHDLIEFFHAPAQKIAVTYEGVDEHYQSMSLPQRGRTQRWLAQTYAIRPPYFLFVSQWRPHKGIETLISAFELFRDRYPRVRPQLVVVGAPHPNYPDILERLTTSRYTTDIIRPGFVDERDLPKLYAAAELFVFPSEYEGFGLPPLEAMASGTPVLAAQTSCLPEILGDAARYAQPGDAAAWAEAMHRIVTDRSLWSQLRAAGTRQARRYSWQKMARETLAIYTGLTSRPGL